jgi:hypothetical protein
MLDLVVMVDPFVGDPVEWDRTGVLIMLMPEISLARSPPSS